MTQQFHYWTYTLRKSQFSKTHVPQCLGFPDVSVVKNLLANAGDMPSVPGSGRSRGEGNSNLLQYSCLGNPMDRGAWWATVHGITKTQT